MARTRRRHSRSLTGRAALSGAAAVLALGLGAAPAFASAKPPVSIDGKVTNEGVGKVKDGAVDVEADDFSFDKTFLKSASGSVEVTVENGVITDVTALQLPDEDRKSLNISNQVEPMLQSEALQAQSADLDVISGATYTSLAYAQSLQSALDRLAA